MLRVASAVLGALSVGLLSSTPVAQKPALPPRTTFVELDAVVLKAGRPVRGLHKEDFQVLEDDRSVPVVSFTEVAAAGLAGEADGRSVVLLLGNTDLRTQIVARLFVAGARPADSIAVIRMTHRDDEVTGDRQEALRRIGESQRMGIVQGRGPTEDSLETVARVAHELESVEHRHKILVCIAAGALCNTYLPPPKTYSLLWPHWTKALAAAARAHVSVFYVSPAGTGGFIDLRFANGVAVPPTAVFADRDLGDGLVEHTGGDTFFNSNNYQRIVDRVWDEAGHYYLLGYVPVDDRPRELHSIHVRMTRRGLHVRSRRSRGDQAFSTKEGTGE
jgi:VWFA-related protein